MKIGIVASELYDGGEITWTTVLVKSLVLSKRVDEINIYINKHHSEFLAEFQHEKKVKLTKVCWCFRFDILNVSPIISKIIKFLSTVPNFMVYKIYGLNRINEENDICIFSYVATEALYCKIPYLIIPHDLRRAYFITSYGRGAVAAFRKFAHKLKNWAYSRTIKNARLIVAESKYVKKDLIKFYGVDPEKIAIIESPVIIHTRPSNPAILNEVREKLSIRNGYLFYPGHFTVTKNHVNLIRAIALIKEKFNEIIPVIFVGSKKDSYDDAMNLIAHLGLADQIRYLGYVPDTYMKPLYELATALVIPTVFESLSMPIWEAFHLGTPVVSSNVCALPEQIGGAGLLFDPHDIDDIAEKVYKIWVDKELRHEIIKKGHDRVRGLTFERYAFQWEDAINLAVRDDEKTY